MANDYDFDDDAAKDVGKGGKPVKDFDCPGCNANNPVDEPIAHGHEVRCNYCGSEFKVTISGEGRMKFKEV